MSREAKRAYDRERYANADKTKIMQQRRDYYEANKEKVLARTRAWTLKRLAGNRELVEFKKNVPCMDCGNSFPTCAMDFDHRPDEDKSMNISVLMRNWKVSESALLKEIDKCDVVCANCHRIRTTARLKADRLTDGAVGRASE